MFLHKILTAAALLIFIIGFIFILNTNDPEITYIDGNQKVLVKKAVKYWEKEIEKNKPEKVSAEFTYSGNKLNQVEAHVLAHSFGEAMYKTKGVDGVSMCPDDFSYGCYHQFIGAAIYEVGFSAVEQILTACRNGNISLSSCGHAVGHGNLSNFGYSLENLTDALNYCGSVSENVEESSVSKGCIGGTFMEYNLRRLAESDRRELTPETAFEPCVSLGSSFRLQCIFQLPIWWLRVIDLDLITEKFKKIGSDCSLLQDVDDSRTCFQSIGYLAATHSNLVPERSIELCEIAKKDGEDYLYCLSGAVRKFMLDTEKDFVIEELCKEFGLRDEWFDYCIQYGTDDENEYVNK